MGGVDVQQAILRAAPTLKASQKQFVALAPSGAIPPVELARVFAPVEHTLPDVAALRAVAERVCAGGATCADAATVAESARGLAESEAENAFALASVRDAQRAITPAAVWPQTVASIRQSSGGVLELARGAGGFDTLGGLGTLKRFALGAVGSPLARGLILLGVPGGGKTAFALALGAETNLPVYLWDLGRMFGSLVGESEASARRVIAAIEATGRCIVLLDEIEKGAAGMGSSGNNDSGTTARTMGAVLTWLSDRQPGGAYVVATCNNVQSLPPEMMRAERWDGLFFVDLPKPEERRVIYAIHAKTFGIEEPFDAVDTASWTGAEIKSLCRTAAMLKVPLADAAQYVVPLSRSRSEEIETLRTWAKERTVAASDDVGGRANASGRKVRFSTGGAA